MSLCGLLVEENNDLIGGSCATALRRLCCCPAGGVQQLYVFSWCQVHVQVRSMDDDPSPSFTRTCYHRDIFSTATLGLDLIWPCCFFCEGGEGSRLNLGISCRIAQRLIQDGAFGNVCFGGGRQVVSVSPARAWGRGWGRTLLARCSHGPALHLTVNAMTDGHDLTSVVHDCAVSCSLMAWAKAWTLVSLTVTR